MSRPVRRSSLVLAVGLCLSLPLAVLAQSEPEAEATPATVPQLEGLAWYQSVDVTGAEIQSTRDTAEVAEWAKLVEGAGATLDELEYEYFKAFEPAALPSIGEYATVRVAGANTDALRAAVVQDIVDQMVGLGGEAPVPQETVIDGKDVVTVALPEALGLADAIVYASGDIAYVLLLDEELAAQALAQLP